MKQALQFLMPGPVRQYLCVSETPARSSARAPKSMQTAICSSVAARRSARLRRSRRMARCESEPRSPSAQAVSFHRISGEVEIGDYCMISANTCIVGNNYEYNRLDIPIREQAKTSKGIRIGRDVWIGANCTILDGASIGDGCIIAPNSLVSGAAQREPGCARQSGQSAVRPTLALEPPIKGDFHRFQILNVSSHCKQSFGLQETFRLSSANCGPFRSG